MPSKKNKTSQVKRMLIPIIILAVLMGVIILLGNIFYNKQYTKYRTLQTTEQNKLTKQEIIASTKEAQWELDAIVTNDDVLLPVKSKKPRILTTDTLLVSVDCNLEFTASLNSSSEDSNLFNELQIRDDGSITLKNSVIDHRRVYCDTDERTKEVTRFFTSTFKKNLHFYSVENKFLLKDDAGETIFVFSKS